MRKQDTNYAVLTGILIGKDRNANHAEIKRPILDLEIIRERNGEPLFEQFPVIICDVSVAKPVAGYKLGDILTVQGTVRNADDGSTYLEADEIARVQKSSIGESKTVEYALSRIELAQLSPRFNLGILIGKIKQVKTQKESENLQNSEISNLIEIKRSFLSRGNLNEVDAIEIKPGETDAGFQSGDEVLCMGEFGGESGRPSFYPSTIRLISKEITE